MKRTLNSPWMLVAGVAFGVIVGGVGAWLAIGRTADRVAIPEIPLHASASAGESLLLATGPIADGMDGIMALDKLTGDLTVWVINPRSGNLSAIFKYNVAGDMEVEQGKKPDYTMVVGQAAFRGAGASRSAQCIVYVGEGGSGNVCGYVMPWSPTAFNSDQPAAGVLRPILRQKARVIQIEGE